MLLEKLDAIDQKLRPIQKNVRYRNTGSSTLLWNTDELYVGEATFNNGQTSLALFAYEKGGWVIFPVTYKGDSWPHFDNAQNVSLASKNLDMTKVIVGSFYTGWKTWKKDIASKLEAIGVTL